MVTVHHCKCANNVNGLCYGDCSSTYQTEVQRGQDSEFTKNFDTNGNFKPFDETQCPGYIAPGQPMYPGVRQGDTLVKPFN